MEEETNFFEDRDEIYLLMNKDEVLIKFKLECNDIFELAQEIKVYRKPFWVKNLTEFLSARKAPAHRKHISELLVQCGCSSLKGYLDFTHALSLNDTLWVKKESEKELEWSKVSLYRNEFDETIAKIAFSGGMCGEQFSSLTPELGTNGQFAKCWIREDDIYLIKTGSDGAGNLGLEPYSEYYGSELLSDICDNVVQYDLVIYRNKLATKCKIFTSEDIGFIPIMYTDCGSTLETIYEHVKNLGFSTEFKNMMIGDTVIMNEDRHLGNFGVLVDNNSFEILGFAPLFDHNISMLCYVSQSDFANVNAYMKDLNKGHKLGGGTFVELGRKFLTTDNKKKLRGLLGFGVETHWKYNLDEWRLKALSGQVDSQIKGLLK